MKWRHYTFADHELVIQEAASLSSFWPQDVQDPAYVTILW